MTVRHFLSFLALRTTPEFELTEDAIKGIDWRSSANSSPGQCRERHRAHAGDGGDVCDPSGPLEIVFDHSVAKDKEFVAVEGANHGFQPCRPEFGDTRKRTFDYVESWLNKPGRFDPPFTWIVSGTIGQNFG